MELKTIVEKSEKKQVLSQQEAEYLIEQADYCQVLAVADTLRKKYFQNKVHLCSIINARSGKCSENCSFCAQSSYYSTDIKTYPLVAVEVIWQKYLKAKQAGANCFSIVTSGKGSGSQNDFETILTAIRQIRKHDPVISLGVSIGIVNQEQMKILKSAGVTRYHHNLETAASYFPKICTTHSYQQRIDTVIAASEQGLEICCGGLLGLGETAKQRAEFALTIRQLNVDSIPLNFLNPIPGTKAYQDYQQLSLEQMLRSIAVFRILNPDKVIGIIGGREINFQQNQKLIFQAGANGIMVGDYLTTSGNKVEADESLIKEAGLVKI